MGIRKAMYAFIDRLQPSDRAAVVGIGQGSPSTPFTADRDRLKKAIEGMVGQHQESGLFLHSIGISEAIDIQRQVPGVLDKVFDRECSRIRGRGGAFISADVDMCTFEIEQQANEMARSATADGQDTVSTIRRLLNALKAIDAPKTMVLVSEGFIMEDQHAVGGRARFDGCRRPNQHLRAEAGRRVVRRVCQRTQRADRDDERSRGAQPGT